VASIPGELPLLQDLNVHRDLVFIDQRGTGGSHPLTCPAIPATLADKQVLQHSIESCLAHLRGDLRFYTTAIFTDDVNHVLAALRYHKVNLQPV
jgi:pimeloyl-ACP methyl ester carboxylesterase